MSEYLHLISRYFRHQLLGTYRIRMALFVLFAVVILAVGGVLLSRNASVPSPIKAAAVKPTAPAVAPPPPQEKAVIPTLEPVIDPVSTVAKAVRAYQAGDYDLARASLVEVDLEQVGSSVAWELAGELKERDGDLEAAMKILSRGIDRNPTRSLYYRRAILYRKKNDLDRAMDDLVSAASYAPTDFMISNERLLLRIQMGEVDQVREEVKNRKSIDGTPAGWIFAQCGLALEDEDYGKAVYLLTVASKSANREFFAQMLENPVIARHQSRPELLPFYTRNAKK